MIELEVVYTLKTFPKLSLKKNLASHFDLWYYLFSVCDFYRKIMQYGVTNQHTNDIIYIMLGAMTYCTTLGCWKPYALGHLAKAKLLLKLEITILFLEIRRQ